MGFPWSQCTEPTAQLSLSLLGQFRFDYPSPSFSVYVRSFFSQSAIRDMLSRQDEDRFLMNKDVPWRADGLGSSHARDVFALNNEDFDFWIRFLLGRVSNVWSRLRLLAKLQSRD